LRIAPSDFNIIDAVISSHGNAGRHAGRRLETSTIVASNNLLLTDWAGALKMGADPYASTINAQALHTVGLPAAYEVVGDLAPYVSWVNVHPMMLDAVLRRNRSARARSTVEPWLQDVDRQQFPFKRAIDDRLNALLAGVLPLMDDHAGPLLGTALMNYVLSSAIEGIEVFNTLYRKQSLDRKVAPLQLDVATFGPADFEAVATYVEPLERIVRDCRPDRNGLRWRYLDRSVLFEFSRQLPFPFDSFVSCVDISRAIQFMTDYIGGSILPIARDRQGRVIHQMERNLYLPQPNWMAVFGGKMIDVEKLEIIRFERNEHKILWRTVRSANASAEFDDGCVTFTRTEGGKTRLSIIARQKFALPLLWQAVNLDLLPSIKDHLVAHAYTQFFASTVENFSAAYEGRDFRVGRDPSSTAAGGSAADLVEMVNGLLRQLRAAVPGLAASWNKNGSRRSSEAEAVVDAEGFAHFRGDANAGVSTERISAMPRVVESTIRGLPAFLSGLASAVRKDLSYLSNSTGGGSPS
jgi:hypothetical protein